MTSNKYKRIIILGAGGSGKTNLSKKIAKIHKIPLYHLDKEYWLSGWKRPNESEWVEKLKGLVEKDAWVMDGNYIDTLDIRLEKADLVIMLDIEKKICVRGIFFRTLKGLFIRRKDLSIGCKDSFNQEYHELVSWAKSFKEKYYPQLMGKCKQYPNVEVKLFKKRKQAKKFIKRNFTDE